MKKTILPHSVLVFPVLILILCAGCTKNTPKPKPDVDSLPAPVITPNEFDKPEPLVEPLVPKIDSPEGTDGTTKEPSAALETTSMVASPTEKYAVEAVPLPPIDDLTAQVDEYMTKLGTSLENLDGSTNYKADATDVVRDASALSLVALAIGLTDADSKYKKSAPNIIVAAQNLSVAESFDAGQKAYMALQSALTNAGGGKPLSWSDKTASLTPLMKAVPNLSSTVKRLTNTERKLITLMERKPQQVFGALAALAAISQGSIANVSETTKPDAATEWKKYCEDFRDAALKTNAAARQFAEKKADYDAFKTAMDTLSASCDHCHEVFHPAAIGKE